MKMKVPFFELESQFRLIGDDIRSALEEVFRTQQFILGPQVGQLEETLAQYCETRFAVGVASGSDALLLSLMVLNVGAGDEVILPAFTFFATAGTVCRVGATPVFADIDPQTYNLDPSQVEGKITPRTKAILPVHLYGQCVDAEPLWQIAREKNLFIVEDAAQALGASYRPSSAVPARKAGTLGDLGCFSFYPTKNLGAFGDAGMVVTDEPGRAEKMRILRVHGSRPKYIHPWIGINSRLDTIQAAILLRKFRYLDTWTEERQKRAGRYKEMLRDLETTVSGFRTPVIQYENRHIFHQYVIQAPRRDELRRFLLQEGVGTEIYYPLPLHLQECFSFLGYKRGDLPASERAAEETLALPIYPELTEDQQDYVIDRIQEFYKQ